MSHDSSLRRGSKASASSIGSTVSGGKGEVPSRSTLSTGSMHPLYQSLDSPLDVRGLPPLLTALVDVVQQCRSKYPFDSTIGDTTTTIAKHWLTTDSLVDRIGEIVRAFPGVESAEINAESFCIALSSGAPFLISRAAVGLRRGSGKRAHTVIILQLQHKHIHASRLDQYVVSLSCLKRP